VDVTGDGVTELARRGQLPVTGQYQGWPLYDGRALEAFTDSATAAEATSADGCAPPMSPPPTCKSVAVT